jgi:hypothetical protein
MTDEWISFSTLPPLQDSWEAVLVLATDTSPAGPDSAASPPSGAYGGFADLAPGTHVRRRVVELMEIVLRWVGRGEVTWTLGSVPQMPCMMVTLVSL